MEKRGVGDGHGGKEGGELAVEDFFEVRDVAFAKHRYGTVSAMVCGDTNETYPRTLHT